MSTTLSCRSRKKVERTIAEAVRKALGVDLYASPMDENVWNLDLRNCRLSTVDALGRFKNLAHLLLGSNPLRSVCGLERLSKLEFLDLDRCPIRDITLLSSLESLAMLSVCHTPLRTVPACSSLSSLYAEGTRIENMDWLPRWEHLQYLDLSHTYVCGMESVAESASLRSLIVTGSLVKDLPKGIGALELLRLNDCPLQGIIAIDHLKSLRSLDISRTPTSFFGEASHSLVSLDVSWTNITDLSWLQFFPELQSLSIRGTDVESVGPIAQCAKLKFVDVRLIATSDVGVLGDLPELERCQVTSDQLAGLPKSLRGKAVMSDG